MYRMSQKQASSKLICNCVWFLVFMRIKIYEVTDKRRLLWKTFIEILSVVTIYQSQHFLSITQPRLTENGGGTHIWERCQNLKKPSRMRIHLRNKCLVAHFGEKSQGRWHEDRSHYHERANINVFIPLLINILIRSL